MTSSVIISKDALSFTNSNDIIVSKMESNSQGNIDISGILMGDFSGNLSGNLSSHFLPTQNSTFDIGSAEYKIRHLFVSDNSIWIGDDGKIDNSGGRIRIKLEKNIVPSTIIDAGGDLDSQRHMLVNLT